MRTVQAGAGAGDGGRRRAVARGAGRVPSRGPGPVAGAPMRPDTDATPGHAPAAVGDPGPVRGLFRGQGQVLLRQAGAGRHAPGGWTRRDTVRRSSARIPTARSSPSRGCPRCSSCADKGPSDLVDIAQVFQRSGTLSLAWKDSGITSPADFKGKVVGVWPFGNEYEVTAAIKAAGMTEADYAKADQSFNMEPFLNGTRWTPPWR